MPDDVPPRHDGGLTRRRLLVAGTFAGVTGFVTSRLPRDGSSPLAGRPPVGRTGAGAEGTPAEPAALPGAEPPPPGHRFDRVIADGRVIDPDSGYDRVANVGIDGDRVTAITAEPLDARRTIDATGLVVAPGFIDILSFAPNPFGIWFKVADGVTANLGMHGLSMRAADFFSHYGHDENRPPCHYGGAFDSPHMRLVNGLGTDPATPQQLDTLRRQLDEGIRDGWLGLDVQPEYTPWVPTEEIIALAEVAAAEELPVFFHVRYAVPDDPGRDNAAAIAEVVRVARETGAGVHVDHITSTGGTFTMDESIGQLEEARSEGLEVSACLYPYDSWATFTASARFDPGWQDRFRIDYDDLLVPGSGERLTEASFAHHRSENTLVLAQGAIPEEDIRTGLRTPWIIVASDTILEEGANNHPRGAGTFARTLGRYVRDEGVLSLPDALAKMTILPARRLEGRCPDLQRKGRLQLGADADITVFDADRIADRATVDDPARESVGVQWVLVSGEVVKTPEGVDRDVRPGRPLRPEI